MFSRGGGSPDWAPAFAGEHASARDIAACSRVARHTKNVPGTPKIAVILTKVRIQSYGRCPLWLWILTFVRMTGRGERSLDLQSHRVLRLLEHRCGQRARLLRARLQHCRHRAAIVE